MTGPSPADQGASSFAPHQVTGRSPRGFSDATDFAVARAYETCPALTWYEVVRLSGTFQAGKILIWEVLLRVGTDDAGDRTAEDGTCTPAK